MTTPAVHAFRPYPIVDGSGTWTTLPDGSSVRIRPVRASDAPQLESFLRRAARGSFDLRFFSAGPSGLVLARRVEPSPSPSHVSLVMEVFDPIPRIVGHAEYDRIPASPTVAEVAFLVDPDFQGRGVGTTLLRQLAHRARVSGIARFAILILLEDEATQNVLVGAGYPYRLTRDGTEMLVEIDIRSEPRTDPARYGPFGLGSLGVGRARRPTPS